MRIMEQADTADWRSRGACRTHHPDRLFVRGSAQHEAKIVCIPCPVRAQCLAEALDNRIEFGVWGGMTERERRALLRRRPEVRSWAELIEGAASHYEVAGGENAKAG
jgi:WhiB family transcriptional regulator, redox-sensing transcriptional regulator